MNHPITITYHKSLNLKSDVTSDTIYVSPSNNLILIMSQLNTKLAARGDRKLSADNVVLDINNTASGSQQTLKGNDTLSSKGFKATTEKNKLNTATLRAKGSSTGGCIIM